VFIVFRSAIQLLKRTVITVSQNPSQVSKG
jgi:hypothetical protein